MIIHAQIDLSGVDLEKFEAYEDAVIPLLDRYGIEMVARLRSEDGSSEVHVLEMADLAAMQAFRKDADRARVQHLWDESGAIGAITTMKRVS